MPDPGPFLVDGSIVSDSVNLTMLDKGQFVGQLNVRGDSLSGTIREATLNDMPVVFVRQP